MSIHPLAGQAADPSQLANIPRLMREYYTRIPDPERLEQRVSFGTSGHRGSSLSGAFTESHIGAITQAICEYRRAQGTDGPLFLGIDTHALSESAFGTALEVLAANAVDVMIDSRDGYTPTPAISHAILVHNHGRAHGLADGIVVTPSHNPPEDGGFKYNGTNGGPADGSATRWIEDRANALLSRANADVRRIPLSRARTASTTHRHDFATAYVADLGSVIDFDAIRNAALALAVDPLGGAGLAYWPRIAEKYGVALTVVSDVVDPTFGFMTRDWDGKIRMDCSSPYAMRRLVALAGAYDVAWASDPDHDRHGIVTRGGGLLKPNHYLAVAIAYLTAHRPAWPVGAAIGKTVVSSSLIDRVVRRAGRALVEVPVGFKWFVDGLMTGALGFGGEESAGASFLRRDGQVWTTDKDGIILGLLAAEITAVMERDPGELYAALAGELGDPEYARIDAPANAAQKAALASLRPEDVEGTELAGEPILARLTAAPGNGAPIGGLKVVAEHGWFAARPSGTEEVYKLYAESFHGPAHLERIQREAQTMITDVFARAGL